MKLSMKVMIFILTVAVSAIAPLSSYANRDSNLDVVLVMDSSGSMKKTDPQSLRIPAAKLFISLLDKEDRAGIISFSDTGYPVIGLTPVDSEDSRDKLFRAAELISSKGLHTNLHDAFASAMEVLSESSGAGRTKIIVIMSDGMMDVGDPDRDGSLLDKIKTELSDLLEERGIKVYAIAFTEQSDRDLMEKISKRTGGFYNLALSDKDFHLIFTAIFESLKAPEMLPMSNNGFLIDSSIDEVTIVATKESADTTIQITSPEGKGYTHAGRPEFVSWFASSNFDMITVKKPAEGKWEILFSTGKNNKAYIITDLKLQTDFDEMYSTFGKPLDIKIWLEKEGSVLTEKEILDTIKLYLELTGPDGKITTLKPFNKGEGAYLRKIAPFSPGNYKLRIVAEGKTFQREKAFVFNVADARESKEDIEAAREKEKKAEVPAEEKQAEETSIEELSWKKTIIQFLIFNAVLAFMVLAYLKRNSLKNMKARLKRKGPAEPETGEQDIPGALTGPVEESLVEEQKEMTSPEEPLPDADLQEEVLEAETINLEQTDDERIEVDVPPVIDDTVTEPDTGDDRDTGENSAEEGFEELSQTDLDQLLQSDEAKIERKPVLAEDDYGPTEQDAGEMDELNGQHKVDEIWEKAFNEKKAADTEDQDKDTSALDLEIERLEKVKQEESPQTQNAGQDDSAQDSADDMWAEAMTEQKEAEAASAEPDDTNRTEEPTETQEPKQDDSAQDNADDMWAEAMTEQKEAETAAAEPDDTNRTEEPREAQEPGQDDPAQDNADDMWAEAMTEQKEAEAAAAEPDDKNRTEEPREAQEPTQDDSAQDSADDMWAEALSGQMEAAVEQEEDKKAGKPPASGRHSTTGEEEPSA